MIIHVDMSNHYDQKSHSVVGWVSVENNVADNKHKQAMAIGDPIRKELVAAYGEINMHAAILAILLEGVDQVEKVIICEDVRPLSQVTAQLLHVLPGYFGRLKSLRDVRREAGLIYLKSQADAFVNNVQRHYHKRNNRHRRPEYFDDGSVIIIDKTDTAEYQTLVDVLEKIKKGKRD